MLLMLYHNPLVQNCVWPGRSWRFYHFFNIFYCLHFWTFCAFSIQGQVRCIMPSGPRLYLIIPHAKRTYCVLSFMSSGDGYPWAVLELFLPLTKRFNNACWCNLCNVFLYSIHNVSSSLIRIPVLVCYSIFLFLFIRSFLLDPSLSLLTAYLLF